MLKFKEGDAVAPIKGIRGDEWYGVMCTVIAWSWCPAGYHYLIDNGKENKDFAEDDIIGGDTFQILYAKYNAERIEKEKVTVEKFARAMTEYLRERYNLSKDATLTNYIARFTNDFLLIEEAGFRIVKEE